MSAVALEQPPLLDLSPRSALRPLPDAALLDDAETPADEIQPWELHSELVLVSPEVRRLSLELLPDPTDVLAVRPVQRITPAPAPADEPAPKSPSVLRYAARRVGEVTWFGLAIVGTIFTIAMIAEVLAH